MSRKKCILLITALFLVFSVSTSWSEPRIPSKPFQGMSGLKRAIDLQKETGLPIILWSTWNTCPNCIETAKWFLQRDVRDKLRNYPKVILYSKGNDDEVAESKRMGFKGGNFYIIHDYNKKSFKAFWAWEEKSYVIKNDLLTQMEKELNSPVGSK